MSQGLLGRPRKSELAVGEKGLTWGFGLASRQHRGDIQRCRSSEVPREGGGLNRRERNVHLHHSKMTRGSRL